jgi:hypothetical protein
MRKKMMGGGMMQRPMYKSGGKIKKPKVKKIIAGGMGKAKDYPGIKKIMEMNKEGRKKFNMGGSLKSVPAGNKGLKKLPTEVRNKMGFMKKGGKVKTFKKAGFKDTLLQFKDLMTGSKDSKISKQKENLKKQILKNKNKEKNNGK